MAGGMNRGVPPETILRHAMREKQQEIEALQSEIERLQSEIAWRDEAIAAFKSWQSKMASYKCDYWLTEGLKLMEEQPEEPRFRALRRLVINSGKFCAHFRQAEEFYNLVRKDREKLKEE